jgi:hypothetical protein
MPVSSSAFPPQVCSYPGTAPACDGAGVDAAHAAATVGATAATQRRYRPEAEGHHPRSSVSRRLPWLRVVARRHHEVRAIAAAVGTAEPEVDRWHERVAGRGNQRLDTPSRRRFASRLR